MQKILDTLYERDMTRIEFLVMLGAGVLSVMGITAVFKNFESSVGKNSPAGKKPPAKQQASALNYSGGVYGGSESSPRVGVGAGSAKFPSSHQKLG